MAFRIVDASNHLRFPDTLGTNYTAYSIGGWYQLSNFGWSGTNVLQYCWTLTNSAGTTGSENAISLYIYRSSATQYAIAFDDYLPSGGALLYTGTWDDAYHNQWWHIMAVRAVDNPKRRIYVNGNLVSSQNNSEAYAGTALLYIYPGVMHRRLTRGYPFLGDMFDFRAYNRTLAADEVAEIAARKGVDSILDDALYLRCGIKDGYAGSAFSDACKDHSIYKSDGTVVGSPLIAADPYSTVKPPVIRLPITV